MVGRTKPPLHLFPTTAIIRGAMVMALGAKKYKSPYNWRQYKVAMSVYLDAADRHLKSFLDGEDIDQESGQSHLAHALCCFAILIDAIECDTAIDDRPLRGPSARLIRELTQSTNTCTMANAIDEIMKQVQEEAKQKELDQLKTQWDKLPVSGGPFPVGAGETKLPSALVNTLPKGVCEEAPPPIPEDDVPF